MTTTRVWTDQLSRARQAQAEVEAAMNQVRLALRELLQGAPGWAADGRLLAQVQSMVATVDEAALRSQADATGLDDALQAAAGRYAEVEAAARARRAR